MKKEFYSLFRYSREMSEDIQILLNKTDTRVLDKYQIEIIENKIFIIVKVMNILFRRTSNGLEQSAPTLCQNGRGMARRVYPTVI